jgi:aminopeptidase N
MSKSKTADLDIYLFVPGEIGLSSDIMSESDFYYNSITQKRAYYSDKNLLPLVHSRLAQRGRLSSTQYRVSLSLFAYQYVVALDKAVKPLILTSDSVAEQEIDNVIELSLDILKRLRRSIPYEENLKRYYANIDNYLSWYTEQKFLSIVAHLTRDQEYKTLKDRLIVLAEKEQAHRVLNNYNSSKASTDINRLSNKMRLLLRLIENQVVLKE